MKERKRQTFIYQDLGFPVKLIKAPMKKVFGQWFLDVNLGQLQKTILNILVLKPVRLIGAEIRFIRKYLEMTTNEFGLRFGATHAAVLKWEKNESQMNPATELCIRMYVIDILRTKDKEFRKVYHFIFEDIVSAHREKSNKIIKYPTIEIDPDQEMLASS